MAPTAMIDRELHRHYHRAASRYSDVRQHLPVFVRAVVDLKAQAVVELGSRSGVSTIAWMHGLAQTGGHLWTVDLAPAPRLPRRPWWHHIEGDDLSFEVLRQMPVLVDVLFIDTSHDFDHTLAELELYVPLVRSGGVVFLHDTDLEIPDGVKPQEPFPVRRAVAQFCASTGLPWWNTPGSFGLGRIDVP